MLSKEQFYPSSHSSGSFELLLPSLSFLSLKESRKKSCFIVITGTRTTWQLRMMYSRGCCERSPTHRPWMLYLDCDVDLETRDLETWVSSGTCCSPRRLTNYGLWGKSLETQTEGSLRLSFMHGSRAMFFTGNRKHGFRIRLTLVMLFPFVLLCCSLLRVSKSCMKIEKAEKEVRLPNGYHCGERLVDDRHQVEVCHAIRPSSLLKTGRRSGGRRRTTKKANLRPSHSL